MFVCKIPWTRSNGLFIKLARCDNNSSAIKCSPPVRAAFAFTFLDEKLPPLIRPLVQHVTNARTKSSTIVYDLK